MSISGCTLDTDTIILTEGDDGELVADARVDGDSQNAIVTSTAGLFVRGVERVDALPEAPVDGHLISIQPDVADTPGLRWWLEWDATLGLWYPVGEQVPIFREITTQETRTADTYNSLTTVGPVVTAYPFSGGVRLEWGAEVSGPAGGGEAAMGIKFGATEATDAWATFQNNDAYTAVSRSRVRSSVVAGEEIRTRYRSNNADPAGFRKRWLKVYPTSVSGGV